MRLWFTALDRLLRGEATRMDVLRSGGPRLPTGGLLVLILLLGMFYGACMALYSVLGYGNNDVRQIPSAMIKVPALFLLTLFVTFPSMYVFNALVGSRLRFIEAMQLLVAAILIMLTVLASLGPIVAFFSVSTPNYPFMVLLNVVMFAIAGGLGLRFLMQTLRRMTLAAEMPPQSESPPAQQSSELSQVSAVRAIFRIWVIAFGLVGAQMGWVLRPWLGAPGRPFEWIRDREQNIFIGVINKVSELIRSWQ